MGNAFRWIWAEKATGRLLALLLITATGWALGSWAGADQVQTLVTGQGYFLGISFLLAVGLYGSAHGISLTHLRADLHTVVLAVTVGVMLKAALITLVMWWLWPGPEALVVGIAVAQIDPLSVAALQKSSRMSERGKALLLAWASFDDPVTTLLTLYAAAFAVNLYGLEASAELGGAGLASVLAGFATNLGIALLAWVLWRLIGRVRGGHEGTLGFALSCALLAALLGVAVTFFWMLSVALAGLFLRPVLARARPAFENALGRLVSFAFVVAVLGVGLTLTPGVELKAGLVLGVTAFLAQSLVALLLARSHTPRDRVGLALAQQNGITAIVLALLLLPVFPGIVGIVAPAVLTINLLHAVTNGLADRWPSSSGIPVLLARRRGSPATPAPLQSGPDPIPPGEDRIIEVKRLVEAIARNGRWKSAWR